MKGFLLICFCANWLSAHSKRITNNIAKVEKGVFNGNTTIYRVDSLFIGQLVVNEKKADSIYFIGSTTVYDTAGKFYTTVYNFLPSVHGISFNVDIIISFDKPFLPWYTTEPLPPNAIVLGRKNDVIRVSAANGEAQSSNRWSVNFYLVRVRGTINGDDLKISVRSKERLYAKIESVYGAIGSK